MHNLNSNAYIRDSLVIKELYLFNRRIEKHNLLSGLVGAMWIAYSLLKR
jgi:hypothetical protein